MKFLLHLLCLALLAMPAVQASQSTAERATGVRAGDFTTVGLAASTQVYSGTLAAINASGYAVAASDATAQTVIGIFTQSKNNEGANGALTVQVRRGVCHLANSVTNAVAITDIGGVCYVEDDHTVASSTSNSSYAGIVVEIDSTGVWTEIRYQLLEVGTVANGAINAAKLASDAVTTAKILDSNVTAGKLASDAVTTAKILDDAVTTVKILNANVTAAKLASDAVTTAKILDANVTTTKILDANVTADKLATSAVTTAKILDGTIIAGDIASDAVTTAKILDANVTTAKITDANVTPAKTNIVEARTVTADGTTTGTISATTTHVTVTSDDANKILILPAPTVGRFLVIHAPATGFELRSSSPDTVAINGGTGSAAESAIPANATVFITCVTATAWKGYYMDADGDLAKIEAAAP